MRSIVDFSENAHLALAAEICKRLKMRLSPTTINRFSYYCLGVQLNGNCREVDVFGIQPFTPVDTP